MVAHDGALHLLALDALLDDGPVVKAQGVPDSVGKLGGVVHLVDPHRGTGADRLNEHGVAQGAGGLLLQLVQTVQIPAAGFHPAGVGDAGGGEEGLGHAFVHAVGAGGDAAAHIGDAGHLQKALDGAVLAVAAVEHREDHVHPLRTGAAFLQQQNAVGGSVGGDDGGDQAAALLPASVLHTFHRAVVAEPPAVLGDAQHQHVKPLPGDGTQHRGRAPLGDFMLAGRAAENDGNLPFIQIGSHSLRSKAAEAAGRGILPPDNKDSAGRGKPPAPGHNTIIFYHKA